MTEEELDWIKLWSKTTPQVYERKHLQLAIDEIAHLRAEVEQLTFGRNAAEGELRQVHADYERLMSAQKALEWCAKELAAVSFIHVQGVVRVKVSAGGRPMLAERDTFEEAVTAARRQLELERKAKADRT